ncbi:hypothetical protein DVA67_022555 [Solirubrobacter sp. CPCC 204708]|uniref:Thiol:disulfide interchange protein DsbD N-terminal domain-containing protein n=1 Tax=Solirubrobacter deserti TaxID=2282478 RepID=A0ABT4RHX7_9ACTN|nr:hypothetical protein [Solirubrobacter deserti]MBE2318774.1 hypothetical protein [Solirubrobacter deserti]MDA0138154.1 hypothetical protein [Solirubrobacter deserti]
MHRSLVGLVALSALAVAAPAQGAEVTFRASQPMTGASLRLTVPADLTHVSYERKVTGRFVATAGRELERLDGPAEGVFSGPASGRELLLEAETIELRSAALTVTDDTAPTLEVPRPSRASGTLELPVSAADAGVGLERVVATIDGQPVASAAFGACTELTPADATIDRALGVDCPARGTQTLRFDTARFNGEQADLVLLVTDAAGNHAVATWPMTFENPTVQGPHVRPPAPAPTGELEILGEQEARYTTRSFLRIPSRPRVSKAGTLTLTARCPLTQTCTLPVTLTRAGKRVASGRVSVRPNGTKRLTLKLSRAARASLERRAPQTMRLKVAGYASVALRVR